MKARYKAVLFDYEGTLVDFQWRLASAEEELRQACAALGCPTEGNYARLWNAAVAAAEPQGRLAEVRRVLQPIYDRWDADAATRWAPRPGAVELLAALGARRTRHRQGDGEQLRSACRGAGDGALRAGRPSRADHLP